MKIVEACQRDVVVAKRDASLSDVAKLMRERHVGCVIVVEADDVPKPVGIVTDRDIVIEVVAAGLDPRSIRVGDIMSAPVVSARMDEEVIDTLKSMRIRGVRRVPVVDDAGWLVGLASIDDLLEIAGDSLNDVVGAIKSQRSVESWIRR
ncbi:MAG: CBS domain-containing protein [Usitatibacter sp.]